MKRNFLILLFIFSIKSYSQDFIKDQLQYARVSDAYNSKFFRIDSMFKSKKLICQKFKFFGVLLSGIKL
jgi:hypothetical protein